MDFLKVGLIGLGGYLAYNYYKKRKTNAIVESAALSTSTAPIIVDAELQEEGEAVFNNAGGNSNSCWSLGMNTNTEAGATACQDGCEGAGGTYTNNYNGSNMGGCISYSGTVSGGGGVKPTRRKRMASRPSGGGTAKGNFYNCSCDGKKYFRVGYPCNSSEFQASCAAEAAKSRIASRPTRRKVATRKFSRADGWDSDTISTGL